MSSAGQFAGSSLYISSLQQIRRGTVHYPCPFPLLDGGTN